MVRPAQLAPAKRRTRRGGQADEGCGGKRPNKTYHKLSHPIAPLSDCGQSALCFSTTASKVSSYLCARNLTFAPDIHTSLQSSDLVVGFDIQSLLSWIFQMPVDLRPAASINSKPSGRR